MDNNFRWWMICGLIFLALAGMLGFALQIASAIDAISAPRSEVFGASEEHQAAAYPVVPGSQDLDAPTWICLPIRSKQDMDHLRLKTFR